MSKTEDSTRRPARGPRIGLAQIAPALGDAAANLERHRAAVEKAAADGCDLLVFPELSLAGYRLKDSVPDVAIRRGSDTWKELEKLSAEVALVVGFVEESADHLFYNSAAYFEAGKCLAVHRKTYLPTYGMFDEQRYFARGRGIAAFDTKCGRVAMLVCEDMLHPSAVTIAACDGATLLVVPSASPARGVTSEGDADSNARSWESYNQVMARSFGVWVAYCNRVGVEDGVSFWGGAEIISPAGETVVKAAYYDEDYVSAVLSDDAVRRRRIVNPLVRDEDLDLTINELSRIRGRAVAKTDAAEKPAAPRAPREDGDRAPRRDFDGPPRGFDRGGDRPPRNFDGPPRGFDRGGDRPPRNFDGPPRGFDRGGDRPPRNFDGPPRGFDRGGDRPPRNFDGPPRGFDRGGDRPPRNFDGPPRRFDGDAPRPFRPQGGFQERGGFKGPRSGGKPGFGGPPRGRDDGGFGGKPRFGGDKPGFGDKPRFDKPGFGDRPRFGGGDKPGFGDRPRFGGGDKPGFGGRPRFGGGDKPSFGGKPAFGDRPRFGGGDKSSFGAPRDRERPERAGKPFHKGAPKPRGRKDD